MQHLLAENEVSNYNKAVAAECPIEAAVNRIIVIQVRKEYEESTVEETMMPVIKAGALWLPKHAVASTEANGGLDNKHETVFAVIKSIGSTDTNHNFHVNDLVYVFPSVFETMIPIDGTDYMVYGLRDIVAKVMNVPVKEVG